MINTKLLGAAAIGLMLAGCGTDPGERVSGGAAAGAATGAGIGALGGPPGVLAGAAIGGGVGAVTGATTTPSQVDLGRPVWADDDGRRPAVRGTTTNRQAQQALASRGFDPGPVDGVWGQRSRDAAMGFQRANNIEPTGTLTAATLNALNVAPPQAAARRPAPAPTMPRTAPTDGSADSNAPSGNPGGNAGGGNAPGGNQGGNQGGNAAGSPGN